MRRILFLFTCLLAAGALGNQVWAQRHKLGVVNTETPEGQLLQQIGQESDAPKKIALLQEFANKYPKHEAAGWVYEQMQTAYVNAQQYDKALETGEQLLALDPDDLEAAHQNLKAAEAKKDPDLIRKWSDTTSQIAQKIAASQQPKDQDEVENWKARVDFAKQVNTYTEYSLSAAATQTSDPRKKAELIEDLRKRNPQSQYLKPLIPIEFAAYRQIGENDKAVALAEEVVKTDPSDEDMLLVVADSDLQKKRNYDRVLSYSNKIIELVNSKPKPAGTSDADWEKRKRLLTGLAHQMAGKVYYGQNKFAQVDKEMRQALPLLEDNQALKAETLFYLGVADYKLEKIIDAIKFNQQCAAIKSPFQAQAAKNLAVIRSQYRVTR